MDFDMQIEAYEAQVSDLFQTKCKSSWVDLSGDQDILAMALADKWSSAEFVEWFIRKFDLLTVDDVWAD